MDLISLWPLGIAIIGLTLLYQFLPRYRPTVIFLGSAVGVSLAFMGLLQTAARGQELIRHRKVEVAFGYMKRFNQPDTSLKLEQAHDALARVSGETPAEIHRIFNDDVSVSEPLKFVFNFYEEIGLAAQLGYADEPSLCTFFRDIGAKYFSALKPWLDYYRSQPGKLNAHEPYEWIYERWKPGCHAIQ